MDSSPRVSESDSSCLNCGAVLAGRYCANCGQEVKEFRRPFFRLSSEAIKSLLELDGRAFRTLYYLLTKPAHLATEYFSGRRTRYTPPLRLFLVISVSFFLLVSFYSSIRSMEGLLSADTELTGEEVPIAEDEAAGLSFEGDIDEGGDVDNGLDAILEFVNAINLPFFDEQTNANLRRAMGEQAESNLNALLEDPNEFGRGYLEYITIFMLLMIPLLALIQKIVYIRQGHYYVEHLVLTLQNHAFIIMIVFITSITGLVENSEIPVANYVFGFLGTVLYIWMWVYLFLSLKNYFQQGYGITLLKYITTTILYGFVLGLGVFFFAGILFFLF